MSETGHVVVVSERVNVRWNALQIGSDPIEFANGVCIPWRYEAEVPISGSNRI